MKTDDEFLALRTMMLPRDTNGAGTIFGGVILSQIDLAGASIARKYACHRYVTVSMKEVEFHAPVWVGDEVSYVGKVTRIGNTSITVQIRVLAERFRECQTEVEVTTADVTYVAVNPDRQPIPVDSPPDL